MSRANPNEDRIVIVGGGVAGSLLALVLARGGLPVSLIDTRARPTPDFRAEKLNLGQLEQLERLGLTSWFQDVCWSTLPGERRPLQDCGERYDRWVERARAAWPETVDFVVGKADRLETSKDRQAVVLSDGRRLDGRLVVLATGRGERLRAQLGMTRRVISARHSTTLGFSILPRSGIAQHSPTMMAPGRPGEPLGYASVFPMRDETRINVFTYRLADDPWIAALRRDPVAVLLQAIPDLAPALEGTRVVRDLETYTGDLYAIDGCEKPGVVLLGDAFHAPCPASGTGMTRILNDIERLTQAHLPAWLQTPGMDADKISAYYADPIKRRVDRASLERSLHGRASAVDASPYWRMRRTLGQLRRKLSGASLVHIAAPGSQAA